MTCPGTAEWPDTGMGTDWNEASYNEYAYLQTICIMDDDAFINYENNVWGFRHYLRIATSGSIQQEASPWQGGTIGYEGWVGSVHHTVGEVSWVIEGRPGNDTTGTEAWDPDNGTGLLRIYPTNGKSGYMRSMGSTTQTFAPWNAAVSSYAEMFDKVVFDPGVTAYGDLENFLYGCTNVK